LKRVLACAVVAVLTVSFHTVRLGFYCDASAAVRSSDVFPVAITPSDSGYMSAQKDGASSRYASVSFSAPRCSFLPYANPCNRSSKRAIAPDELIGDDDLTARPSVRRKLDLGMCRC
jgi:hypothetical protein